MITVCIHRRGAGTAEETQRGHEAQTLTYMRLGDWRIGLIFNFNVEVLKDGGIRRLANNLDENAEIEPQ